MSDLLLDTHIALWWQLEPRQLSRRAAQEIERAETLWVSPMTIWEIVTLERAAKIRLDRDPLTWVEGLMTQDRVRSAELTAAAAAEAALLPLKGFRGDLVDRFLYATAATQRLRFCTKDGLIERYAHEAQEIVIVW